MTKKNKLFHQRPILLGLATVVPVASFALNFSDNPTLAPFANTAMVATLITVIYYVIKDIEKSDALKTSSNPTNNNNK